MAAVTDDEPIAGGLYRFAEPDADYWVPIGCGIEVSEALLAEAGLSWYNVKSVADRFDAQMEAVRTAPPIPAERFAELREAALRAGQETADQAADVEGATT